MAKRMTDTDKWKRAWFCELSSKAKIVWFYILDQCDHRGVWFVNFKLMSQQVGFKVCKTSFEKWFSDKILAVDCDKYFIPSFVDFQYGKLKSENRAHSQVISFIEKLEIKALASPLQAYKDKDKDKDLDLDKEKEIKEKEKDLKINSTKRFELQFDTDYKKFEKSLIDDLGFTPKFRSHLPDIYNRWKGAGGEFQEFIDSRFATAEKAGIKNKKAWVRKALLVESGLEEYQNVP